MILSNSEKIEFCRRNWKHQSSSSIILFEWNIGELRGHTKAISIIRNNIRVNSDLFMKRFHWPNWLEIDELLITLIGVMNIPKIPTSEYNWILSVWLLSLRACRLTAKRPVILDREFIEHKFRTYILSLQIWSIQIKKKNIQNMAQFHFESMSNDIATSRLGSRQTIERHASKVIMNKFNGIYWSQHRAATSLIQSSWHDQFQLNCRTHVACIKLKCLHKSFLHSLPVVYGHNNTHHTNTHKYNHSIANWTAFIFVSSVVADSGGSHLSPAIII